MKKIRLKAMAKINLGLDVVRKREDGYHEVRMIMQTIRMYDQIELEPTEAPGIRVSTNLNYLPTNEDNLVYKAAKLLMDEFDVKKGLNIGRFGRFRRLCSSYLARPLVPRPYLYTYPCF